MDPRSNRDRRNAVNGFGSFPFTATLRAFLANVSSLGAVTDLAL